MDGKRHPLSAGAKQSVTTIARPAAPLALLIGPEGGFDAREAVAAQAKGFHALGLRPRVLRSETAATAGLATVQAVWGDWR
jgi:16S rRNA (uracil1498-N3)-methyltransferase